MNEIIDYMNNILENKMFKINTDDKIEDILLEKNKKILTLESNYKILKEE